MVDVNIVIFFVFGILYLIGFSAEAYALIIAAGILLIGSFGDLTLFSNNLQNFIFAILTGLFSIYHGIFLIMSERENGRK